MGSNNNQNNGKISERDIDDSLKKDSRCFQIMGSLMVIAIFLIVACMICKICQLHSVYNGKDAPLPTGSQTLENDNGSSNSKNNENTPPKESAAKNIKYKFFWPIIALLPLENDNGNSNSKNNENTPSEESAAKNIKYKCFWLIIALLSFGLIGIILSR